MSQCGTACVQVFIHRLRKYLGAYLILLEGTTDAIVFSAGASGTFSVYVTLTLEVVNGTFLPCCRHW